MTVSPALLLAATLTSGAFLGGAVAAIPGLSAASWPHGGVPSALASTPGAVSTGRFADRPVGRGSEGSAEAAGSDDPAGSAGSVDSADFASSAGDVAPSVSPHGGWRWPVGGDPPPRVVRGFAVGPFAWSPGHRGVDLATEVGAAVRAPTDGVVRFAGKVAGHPVLVIDHGRVRSTYQPVTATAAVGAPVRAGQVVGTVAAGASHCAPAMCMHWGAVRGEDYLDPLRLMGDRGPVVLLPWA